MSREKELNLKELQDYELEILKAFRNICQEHNLRYYITAGTLLGAVRHKGFIPWDDDVDVAMPRRDYDRLAKIMRQKPDSKLFYQDGKTDKLYPFGFAKLRSGNAFVYEQVLDNVKINNGCYIDIFPLDKCPKSDKAAGLLFKIYMFFTTALTKKVNPNYRVGYTKKSALYFVNTAQRLPLGMLKGLREFFRKCFTGSRLCTVGGSHGYPKESYDREWFGEAVMLEFEKDRFCAPAGWEKLLKNMYGSYMEPPDEQCRKGHFTETEKGDKV